MRTLCRTKGNGSCQRQVLAKFDKFDLAHKYFREILPSYGTETYSMKQLTESMKVTLYAKFVERSQASVSGKRCLLVGMDR
jgi:hypothetical protein